MNPTHTWIRFQNQDPVLQYIGKNPGVIRGPIAQHKPWSDQGVRVPNNVEGSYRHTSYQHRPGARICLWVNGRGRSPAALQARWITRPTSHQFTPYLCGASLLIRKLPGGSDPQCCQGSLVQGLSFPLGLSFSADLIQPICVRKCRLAHFIQASWFLGRKINQAIEKEIST